jgi:hypothetical protein
MNELPNAILADRPLRSLSAMGRPSMRWAVVAIFLGLAGLVGPTRADCADTDADRIAAAVFSFGEPSNKDVERLFSHSGRPTDLVPKISNSDPVSVIDDFIDGAPDDSCLYGPRFNIRDDLGEFLPLLKGDARGVVNWNNAAILGGALAAAIAIRQDLDGDVRNNTARYPQRWGNGSETLGDVGDARYQVPVLLAIYGVSVRRDDQELHEFSTALISAYTINGLSTLAIKGIANTGRPSDAWNGGQFGFPSFHASSSFTIASVVDEYYGYKAGLPAYALAGLISWSRIDQRDHDLSDVVFGAALGYVIGHSVAGRHLCGNSRVRLLPYVHPTDGTSGLMVDLSF